MKLYHQILGVVGIWLLITSLFTNYLSFTIWSNTVVGFIVALVAFALLQPNRWTGIIGLIIGIWLIHSFYFLEPGTTTMTMVTSNLISGIILVALGYFSQNSTPTTETT